MHLWYNYILSSKLLFLPLAIVLGWKKNIDKNMTWGAHKITTNWKAWNHQAIYNFFFFNRTFNYSLLLGRQRSTTKHKTLIYSLRVPSMFKRKEHVKIYNVFLSLSVLWNVFIKMEILTFWLWITEKGQTWVLSTIIGRQLISDFGVSSQIFCITTILWRQGRGNGAVSVPDD